MINLEIKRLQRFCVLTMRFNLKPFFINAALAALFIFSNPVLSASFAYIYVEASEGNSSGGHSAIQFGDEIYHYQHLDSGLIRLLRQDSNDFQFQYRFLQNRRLHLSQIEVSKETYNLLKTQFKLQFLAQAQQFKQLDDLHKDRALIYRLLHKLTLDDSLLESDLSSVLRLKGAGLFYAEQAVGSQNANDELRYSKDLHAQSSRIVQILRNKIEQNNGQNFLLRRQQHLESQIKALNPPRWPTGNPVLSHEKFPPAIYSFAGKYSDYLTGLLAIKALNESQPLQANAVFVTYQPEFIMTGEERKALLSLRNQLENSLLKSVNSSRPDWGYALLVNMARLIAIEMSLKLGRWVFIDDYAFESEWLSADQFAQYSEQMQTQISDALDNLNQQRKMILTTGNMTEAHYSGLEMSANRYLELLKGRQQMDLRYIGEKALPSKSISLPDWIVPEITQLQLKIALIELENYERKLFQELEKHYRYDLITRNCVTELFRTIEQALSQQIQVIDNQSKTDKLVMKESTKRLGGGISVLNNFIPFVSFQSVQDHYNVTATKVLNSYRGQQLEKLYAQHNNLLIALRESNIFSTTLYKFNPDDAFFIFFTDDHVLFRPFFGLFNTTAGLGQSVVGFLSWPFDEGNNLKSGVTGIFMSLPELFFFNMRKGSYKYLSYNQLMDAEKYGN
ncbi:MAG: hypothetical protein ACXWTY_07330 [Methylobacter sp.]